MFKSKGLVKVMSIIMIVLSVFSGLALAVGLPMASKIKDQGLPGVDPSLFDQALNPVSIAVSIAGLLVILIAAILGLMGKSFKAAMIFGVIYLLYEVGNIVWNLMNGIGFGISTILSVIVPLLYLWGLYQAKE